MDVGLSAVISASHEDAIAEIPHLVDGGVPTFKAFMVYDFGVDDAMLLALLGAAAGAGGMLEVHCENRTILEALTARFLAAGETGPAFHAASRPPYVEAEATGRAIALAEAAGAPLYVVHLSSNAALDEVRAAQARGRPVFAETCPHYLTLTDDRYALPPEEAARYVISPPLRAAGNPEALWGGLADGALALVATDHVPDRAAVEKQSWRESFDRISNGGPGIETLLTMAWDGGVAAGRLIRGAARRRPVHDAGPAVRPAFEGRDRGRPRRGPRAVRSRGPAHRARSGPPPHQRLHALRGPRGPGGGALDDRPRLVRRPRRLVRRHSGTRAVRGTRPGADALGPPGQSRRWYASRVRNSGKSSVRTSPSRSAAASATRPVSRPIRSSSSSRIAGVASVVERPAVVENRPVAAPLP